MFAPREDLALLPGRSAAQPLGMRSRRFQLIRPAGDGYSRWANLHSLLLFFLLLAAAYVVYLGVTRPPESAPYNPPPSGSTSATTEQADSITGPSGTGRAL